jgi:hypothetical protein
VVDLRDASAPSIEAYFRAVLPSGRPEQLFLRFEGDSRDSVFEECRAAVLTELVEQRGWEIQETTNSGDPSILFQRAVLQPAEDPSQVFTGTPLAGREGLLRSVLTETNEQMTVTGRTYQSIADAIRAFGDTPVVMVVADGDVSLSQAQLLFDRQAQQHSLGLSRESQRLLNRLSGQSPSERAQQPSVQQVPPTRSEPTPSAEGATERSDSDTIIDLPSGQSDGRLPGLTTSLAIGVGVLLVVGVVAFGVMNLSGGSTAQPQIEMSANVSDPVAGEELTVTVTLQNSGNAMTSERTVSLHVEGLSESPNSTKVGSLPDGEKKTVTLSVPTTGSDAGPHTAEVSIENTNISESLDVTVRKPALFEVSIDETYEQCGGEPITEEPMTAGSNVTVEYTVTNTGDVQGEKHVQFRTNGRNRSTEQHTLGGNDEESGTFSFRPEETADVTVTVAADNNDSRTLSVNEPFDFTINSPEEGGQFVVGIQNPNAIDISVTNGGATSDEQCLRYGYSGNNEQKIVNIEQGERDTVVEALTPELTGEKEFSVTAGDKSKTRNITVEQS